MLKFLDNLEEYLAAIALAVMVVINFGNVLSRYVIHASWSWSEEILIIMFVWCVMLATAVAYKRAEHLGLSLITDRLPVGLKKVSIVFSTIMSAALVIFLLVYGWSMVSDQIAYKQATSVLRIPEWVAGLSIPVGAIFIFIRAFQSAVIQISQLNKEEQ